MSIEKLNKCIQNKKANNSRAREAIYNLLLDAEECLNVAQILKKLSIVYPKKISQNTLYRHLNFFMNCKLTIMIQDDFKRAYYYIRTDELMNFCVCTHCNNVTKLDLDKENISAGHVSAEFITIHKVCNKCSLN